MSARDQTTLADELTAELRAALEIMEAEGDPESLYLALVEALCDLGLRHGLVEAESLH